MIASCCFSCGISSTSSAGVLRSHYSVFSCLPCCFIVLICNCFQFSSGLIKIIQQAHKDCMCFFVFVQQFFAVTAIVVFPTHREVIVQDFRKGDRLVKFDDRIIKIVSGSNRDYVFAHSCPFSGPHGIMTVTGFRVVVFPGYLPLSVLQHWQGLFCYSVIGCTCDCPKNDPV